MGVDVVTGSPWVLPQVLRKRWGATRSARPERQPGHVGHQSLLRLPLSPPLLMISLVSRHLPNYTHINFLWMKMLSFYIYACCLLSNEITEEGNAITIGTACGSSLSMHIILDCLMDLFLCLYFESLIM